MRTFMTLCASALVLAACDTTGLDLDMRDLGQGFDTTSALQPVTAPKPQPDARGVISYPSYQVALARRGDTPAEVAGRIGMSADDLARYNGIPVDAVLNEGEVLALPRRVAESTSLPATGGVDIATLAGDAINRASPAAAPAAGTISTQVGEEPVRHKVEAGETAYSIARLYGVSAKSIADWNGLGPDLSVRQGQYLLIPVVVAQPASPETETSTTEPGEGSPTPTPPSASEPLPDEDTVPLATDTGEASGVPESPDLGADATVAASNSARMSMPVQGSIVRDFRKGKNDGIDISASRGASVSAAAAGTVAAITEDTDQVPILVLRHEGGLLTVYANVDNLKVQKGQSVSRGQVIATVRASDNPYLHFEVRDGVEAVDPSDYLK
ncbi:peptidoglycan DD-metalloendopeptidase family protein [Aliiruegeria lutimaris]|uniref:Murein DD-endopeptidase MepM and murein hydrolase activator NlpD, contain LysM domain n=1 Tax=Aliiruegeria lutimaris TaxID=571298 RepID=A0A1G8LD36_9RHOB|nr:peptidoglycan DD-metalloendopeptidase family protein [Aliiruegeria lutimaris]SDI53523.1 Murein DD-endopeptidase MepM and murein hydrolase activator NlpD, contain LysM domain [Aliiruegeria lutimaris]